MFSIKGFFSVASLVSLLPFVPVCLSSVSDPCPSFSFFPNVLTFSYSFLGSSLRFLASFVPLPPVALMIPIFYDRLIDNLSTN